jgi:hypothetical protein
VRRARGAAARDRIVLDRLRQGAGADVPMPFTLLGVDWIYPKLTQLSGTYAQLGPPTRPTPTSPTARPVIAPHRRAPRCRYAVRGVVFSTQFANDPALPYWSGASRRAPPPRDPGGVGRMSEQLELGQVDDPYARRALEQLSMQFPVQSSGAGPIGPQGPQGPQGPAGAQGVQGVPGATDRTDRTAGHPRHGWYATGPTGADGTGRDRQDRPGRRVPWGPRSR